MTLPSTPHLPSPAGSRPPPPSGQSVHPGPACANAPTRKRGGQPGNQNARKTGTYSTCHPGLFSSTLSLVQLLRVQLKDPASSLDQIVEQARTARQALPLPVQALEGEFFPALQLFQTLTKMITRAYSYYIPSRRLSDALSAIAQDPLGYFECTCQDFSISRDADSFFPVSEKSVQYSTLPPPSRGTLAEHTRRVGAGGEAFVPPFVPQEQIPPLPFLIQQSSFLLSKTRLHLSHLRAIMRSTSGLTHPHQDDKLIFLSPYPTLYRVLRKYLNQKRRLFPAFWLHKFSYLSSEQ